MTVSGASSSIPVMLYAVLLVTCLCHVTCGYRMLLIPLPDTGQCRQMVSIGRELKARGHQVILFVPEYFRVRRCTDGMHGQTAEVEIRTFDASSEEDGEEIGAKLERLGGEEVIKGGSGLMGDSGAARELVKDICYSYMESRDDLDQLKREGRFDVVLVDGSPQARCLTLLPAYLGAPFVAVSSYIDPYDSSLPLPTSFYPAPTSMLPGNMGFLQRLSNFLSYARYGRDSGLWGGFQQGNALGERVSRLDHSKLVKKASLYLENSDYIIDYPKALFPNFVQVGGLTAGPSKPLPGPLARFFDESGSTGVVVLSLGPHLFTPTKALEDKMISAFRRLDSRVLARVNASRSMSKLRHVQTVSWFPQNDALGHPSTRLFVSHCGKNSFFEALYHGVPLLCCHFGDSDVLGTAARVAEYGVGLSLDLLTASADSLENAITSLLTERAYSRRMKAASKLFHSRPHKPAERAATAIEHVLKYGGGYLRPRSIDMSFFQYVGLDIALVICTVIFGLLGMVVMMVMTYVMPALPGTHKASHEHSGTSDSTDSPAKVTAAVLPEQEKHSSIVMYILFVLLILFYVFM